jgi:hypothetical protein
MTHVRQYHMPLDFPFVYSLPYRTLFPPAVSLCNSRAQDLRAEESALGALDHLLVDALGRVVHDDGACLVVDFGVETGVADQVDDPFLPFGLGEAE